MNQRQTEKINEGGTHSARFPFQLALDNIVRKLERGGEAEESAPSFFNLTVLN